MIYVKKRNGKEVIFDKGRIAAAIGKANRDVGADARLNQFKILGIAEDIENFAKTTDKAMTVEEIQDYVIREIMKAGYFDVANAYIKYRYNRDLARKKDSTDDEILTLIDGFNKEMAEENSNKDTTLASTQRDYIAGIVSRSLTQRVLLPEAIAKAHNDGLLHFHDADYFIQHIFNCCLIDLGDMLDNGTVMNGKKIDPPNGFQVACTVLTQISAAVASNQLGGQSIDVSHLGKYLRKSHEKFLRKTRAACGDEAPQELVEKIAKDRLIDDLQSGIQTIQYQINTLMTTNGQAPFITLFLCLRDDDPYIEENAMIIEEILKQRLQGIKNEAGVYTTPAFPKLVYVLDENNCLKGGKYDYLTELAVRCSIKRMYPDYISAKKMRENYEGQVFSPMGCVDGRETVKYHYEGNVYTESIEAMWNRLLDKYEVKTQPNGSDLYMDTDGVLIYDHKTGYVKNYRIIRNYSDSWVKVKLTSGHSLLCTTDHPFETENRGVVYAKDLTTDDQISILSNGIKNDKYASYWAYKIDVANVKSVTPIVKEDYSYDVTTESEHFTVSNIYSHNCRSFLTTYKDKDGKYKFEGRFNQGVVTINLPQVALSVTNGGEFVPATEHEFWIELDKRLELCREALMCRHKRLLGTRSDISPLHWQHGAIARLKPGEVIDPLLKNNYSTISLGYIGIYEMTKLMKGQSHTAPEGKEFAMRVMRHLKDTATRWRAESGLGFSLYGTPAESLCYRFARIDKAKYGDVADVTDKGYYTNTYHVDVREKIDAFSKLAFEAEFQPLSPGGCISYVEIPNMANNVDAMQDLVRFIYDNVQYAEFNTKSDYCHVCGFDGEIEIVDSEDGNPDWRCPSCGNRDHSRMTVVRRTCGYLGENYWNVGKTKEIRSRVMHL